MTADERRAARKARARRKKQLKRVALIIVIAVIAVTAIFFIKGKLSDGHNSDNGILPANQNSGMQNTEEGVQPSGSVGLDIESQMSSENQNGESNLNKNQAEVADTASPSQNSNNTDSSPEPTKKTTEKTSGKNNSGVEEDKPRSQAPNSNGIVVDNKETAGNSSGIVNDNENVSDSGIVND